MAYTQVQTIADTNRRLAVKRVNYANTETDALVVNASALNFAVTTLTTVASSNNFMVGETVTASSGGSAIVQDVINSTSVILISATGTFNAADTITGAVTSKVRTQSGSLTPSTYRLQLSRVLYNVFGNSNASKVELMWQGTGNGANNRTILMLSGTGELRLDDHGMRANNNANSATGNITLSTINWGADCHYSLMLDFNKETGYAAPNQQTNQYLGYTSN